MLVAIYLSQATRRIYFLILVQFPHWDASQVMPEVCVVLHHVAEGYTTTNCMRLKTSCLHVEDIMRSYIPGLLRKSCSTAQQV